jgi:hypothetical protein
MGGIIQLHYESFGPQQEVERTFILGLMVHDGVACCDTFSEENAVILFHPHSHSYLEREKQIIFLQSETFRFLN